MILADSPQGGVSVLGRIYDTFCRLVLQDGYLEVDAWSYRQPMELSQHRSDAIASHVPVTRRAAAFWIDCMARSIAT